MHMKDNWITALIKNEKSPAKSYPHGSLGYIEGGSIWLAVGKNLVPLIDPKSNGPILKRVQAIRKHLLFESGINIQGVRVMDNLDLSENEYAVSVNSETIASGCIFPDYSLVINEHETDKATYKVDAHPISGEKVFWIPNTEVQANKLETSALSVVDVIAFHFYTVIKEYYCFEAVCHNYSFTEREKELCKLILTGKSNSEIAELLFISESTVKQHIQNIFEKSSAESRYDLISRF